MSFRYFAYGSNLWPPQMRSRCSSARALGPARLQGWEAVYDKPSRDGSAKMNLRSAEDGVTHGALYEIHEGQRPDLDEAEDGYVPFTVSVLTPGGDAVEARTYRWTAAGTSDLPYQWYVSAVLKGAAHHGLPRGYVNRRLAGEGAEDPIAPGIRPADETDVSKMQEILSAGLTESNDRYTVHPGELAWWMWHSDPHHPDSKSYWIQPGRGLVVVDALRREIGAFASSSLGRFPLLEWAQRRLNGRGEVGWVADSDLDLIEHLSDSHHPVSTDHLYQWDLTTGVPETPAPEGWELRPILGKDEADARRRASHSAFDSDLGHEAHLERYLGFMDSPAYDRTRDLVAASPEGQIASFMVWWPDDSGIAQIEPLGTHSDFQRRGIGTALVHYGLREMRAKGMTTARVITESERRDATAFYESAGFELASHVRWHASISAGAAPASRPG